MFSWTEKLSEWFKHWHWDTPRPPASLPEQEEEQDDDKEQDTDKNLSGYFRTHRQVSRGERTRRLARPFPVTPDKFQTVDSFAQDETDNTTAAKNAFVVSQQVIPEVLFDWYVSQTFIGYQACALIAQHWLIDKGCSMKGRDAVRNGFKLVFDEGVDVPPAITARLEKYDRKFHLKKRLEQADKFKNVFGISHILFRVESDDPDYYEKPFNPDGIQPGSYKGMNHIDPYWVTPLLTTEAVEEPGSPGFYDPTYWVVSGKKYHRSHFVILRGPEVSDVQKPSYLYGGLPLTQLAMERVYAAERTANEAPQLALTKRLIIRYIDDPEKAIANQGKFEEAMRALSEWRDNYGVYVSSTDDKIEQQDTSLSDLDVTIMTQYQIVAGIFGVTATKLLGTSPKGFNATGDHEIKTYHEELESVQENDLTPIVNRHHLCVMRSHIAPMREDKQPVMVDIQWNPLAVMSEKERAETQEIKGRTYKVIQETGAVDGYDIRDSVIDDDDSLFSGIPAIERPDDPDDLDDIIPSPEREAEAQQATGAPQSATEGDQTLVEPYATEDPREPGEKTRGAGDRKKGKRRT